MMINMSFSSLLQRLTKAVPRVPEIDPEESQRKGTTIRLEPKVRKFFEMHSEQLGISIQEMVAMTLRGVMTATEEPQATELELMADRFINLFQSHGVAVADIPALLPPGSLARSDLLSREVLVDRLHDDLLESVATTFHVELEWLKGQEASPVRSTGTWYKNVGGFARHLAELSRECESIRVLFVAERGLSFEALKAASSEGGDSTGNELDIGVVVEITRTVKNAPSFRTYRVWEAQRWNYWRCRYHLKSMMLFCEEAGIRYGGVLLDSESRHALFGGEQLACNVLSNSRAGWQPDQLMWNDERNPELHELRNVRSEYAETGASHYITAVKRPWDVDWDAFRRGAESYLKSDRT